MNPQFPNGEVPGLGAMGDPLAFIKKLWGGMQVPGMVAPTVSLDELDKKIQDLKTVESWLTVNMNMLRGTIQALEVQRATIATFKAMSENFAQAMKAPEDQAASPSVTPDWPPQRAEPAAPEPEVAAESNSEASAADSAANSAIPLTNPAVWWNILQDQFKQAVSNAKLNDLATDIMPAKAEQAEAEIKAKPARKSAAKPSAKAAGKAAPKAAAKAKSASKPKI